MARAHLNKAIIRKVSGTPADGSVQVYEAGTTTALAQTIYAADSGATTKANPHTFTGGIIDFYLPLPQRVKLVVTPTGGSAQTFDYVDVPAVPGPKTTRVAHTFSLPGDVVVPSGSTNVIPGFFLPVPAGQTVTLVGVRVSLGVGTNATFNVTRNGSAITGAGTGIVATTTAATTALSQVITADDIIGIAVTAVTGTPRNMSITFYVDYAV